MSQARARTSARDEREGDKAQHAAVLREDVAWSHVSQGPAPAGNEKVARARPGLRSARDAGCRATGLPAQSPSTMRAPSVGRPPRLRGTLLTLADVSCHRPRRRRRPRQPRLRRAHPPARGLDCPRRLRRHRGAGAPAPARGGGPAHRPHDAGHGRAGAARHRAGAPPGRRGGADDRLRHGGGGGQRDEGRRVRLPHQAAQAPRAGEDGGEGPGAARAPGREPGAQGAPGRPGRRSGAWSASRPRSAPSSTR